MTESLYDLTAPPQAFAVESDSDGDRVIFSNQASAACTYVGGLVHLTRCSELFKMALAYQLASMLAGPILKGKEGAAQSQNMLQIAQAYLQRAIQADANQGHDPLQSRPPWLQNR